MHGSSLIGKSYVVSLLCWERGCVVILRIQQGLAAWSYGCIHRLLCFLVLWRFECNAYIFLVTENG